MHEAEYNFNLWTGGAEILTVQGRSILERMNGGMSCGTEESYGNKHLQKCLVWGYGKLTPQAQKAFAGFFLTTRSAIANLPDELGTAAKNNPKLAEAIKDNSKFFANNYVKEADIIIKSIEKELKNSDAFAGFVHDRLTTESEKAALYGIKYKFAYREYFLEYTKQDSPKKAKNPLNKSKSPVM